MGSSPRSDRPSCMPRRHGGVSLLASDLRCGLGTLAALAVLVLAISASRVVASPSASPDGPEAIRGDGMSGLQIQNLDPSRPATVLLDFFDQRGGGPRTYVRPGIASGASSNFHPPSESGLREGSYAGILTAERPFRTLLLTGWWGSTQATAFYNDALTGRRIVVPVFSGFQPGPDDDPEGRLAGRLSSIVHVQNTDPGQWITATLRLRDSAGALLLERPLGIGPGTSVSLDHAADSILAALPYGSAGTLEASAAISLAVASHLDVQPWPHAAMAFEAMPVEHASTTLFAPLVASGQLATWMAVHNPGEAPARLTLTYRRNADDSGRACGAASIRHAGRPLLLPAGGLLILSQAPAGPSGLPAGCLAGAVIRSNQPLTGVVMIMDADRGTAAAYTAQTAGDAGRRVALPLYRNQHTMDRRTTLIQVMNPSDSALDATLDVLDQTGSMLPCPGCSGQIEASSARLWDPLVTDGLRQRPGTYGSAVVKAEAPVLAIVLESPMNDAVATDMASYAGLAICLPEGGPDAARCRTRNALPHFGLADFGWVMPRPTGQAFLPLAASWR